MVPRNHPSRRSRSPGRRRRRRDSALRAVFCTAVVAFFACAPVAADCIRDREGEVYCGAGRCVRDQNGVAWCSRFDDGDARTTRTGEVLCGRGQCARAFDGTLFCSAVEGGAALKDSRGRVRCEERCEPARKENCERTKADMAG